MSTQYQDWIRAYRERVGATIGKCQSASEEMAAAFPELRIALGHVEVGGTWGRRGHWWLVAPDGSIVDPTADQFPQIFLYEEYEDGQEVRCGRCMNCGEDIYAHSLAEAESRHGACMCGEACEREFIAWQNAELSR